MSKEMKELRGLTDEKLIKKSKELRRNLLMTSQKMANPKFKQEHRGRIRQSIARINTILGERQRRGVVKQEKRL